MLRVHVAIQHSIAIAIVIATATAIAIAIDLAIVLVDVNSGRPPRGLGPPEHEITRQSPNRLYKAPTDNTKPRHIRQNPDILDKAPVSNDLQRDSQYYLTGLVWGAAPAWYRGPPISIPY